MPSNRRYALTDGSSRRWQKQRKAGPQASNELAQKQQRALADEALKRRLQNSRDVQIILLYSALNHCKTQQPNTTANVGVNGRQRQHGDDVPLND